MSFDQELAKLTKVAVESFNKTVGTAFLPEDMECMVDRPYDNSIINFYFVTKDQTDDVRFVVAVKGFAKYTQLGVFEFRLKKNGGFGSLNDEKQVMEVELGASEYMHIRQYTHSQEYKNFLSRKPYMVSMTGDPIRLQSGLILKTQR